METGVAVALIGGAFGLLTAVLTFAQPIVLKLLERKPAPAVDPALPVFPDDPVEVDDPVNNRLLMRALVEELHRQTERADACEARELER